MDSSRDPQSEHFVIPDFAVSIEKDRGNNQRKALLVRHGSVNRSVPLNAAEAQVVMANLMNAFPGAFSELVEAARPLAELLGNQHSTGEIISVKVDSADVARLQNAVAEVDKAKSIS